MVKQIGRNCNILYRRLCVPRTASLKEIKAAYRMLARETHPDIPGGNKADFIKVSEAYQVLSDKSKRRHYDNTGEWITAGITDETRINQDANGILAVAFANIISQCNNQIVYIDIIKILRTQFKDGIQKATAAINATDAALKLANEALDLIEYSGKGVNVFEGVLMTIITENEKKRAIHIKNKENIKAALDIINNYKFNFKLQGIYSSTYSYSTTPHHRGNKG